MIKVNRNTGMVAVRFTPDYYKQAYVQYRQGVYSEVIEMMLRAETDSHVAGCLIGRRAGLQREWTVTPFSKEASDVERAQWLKQVLTGLNIREMLKVILEGRMKKFQVIDFDWEVVEGKQVPVRYQEFEHKYFKYKDGLLRIDYGRTLGEIPPEALTCESKGLPIMFPVMRDFILKEFGIESWASFLETFGEGIIIGKYPPGSGKEFMDAVEAAVNAIARSSRGILPEGATIEIKETQRSTGDHDLFVSNCNRGIAISILGHANSVEQSKGMQVGENLTQYKVRSEIAVDDMYFIEDHVNRLVRTICLRNFNDGKLPVFEIEKKPPIDQTEWRNNLDLAYTMGFPVFAQDVKKLGVTVDPNQQPVTRQNPFAVGMP